MTTGSWPSTSCTGSRGINRLRWSRPDVRWFEQHPSAPPESAGMPARMIRYVGCSAAPWPQAEQRAVIRFSCYTGQVKGNFVLTALPPDGDFEMFSLGGIDWIVTLEGQPFGVTGSGLYVRGQAGDTHVHQLTLDLVLEGIGPIFFDSGLALGGGDELPPLIEIVVDDDAICYGHGFTVSAAPAGNPADVAPRGGDGAVDIVDLLAVLADWGLSGPIATDIDGLTRRRAPPDCCRDRQTPRSFCRPHDPRGTASFGPPAVLPGPPRPALCSSPSTQLPHRAHICALAAKCEPCARRAMLHARRAQCPPATLCPKSVAQRVVGTGVTGA